MAVESSKIIEGLAFEITSGKFTVRSDVSVKDGGQDTAPNPHNYLEIALAACTAITLQMYAQRKAIPLKYADVKVKITVQGPAGNEMTREIQLVGDLTEEQKQKLMEIAEKCPVHKFLSVATRIQTTLVGAVS